MPTTSENLSKAQDKVDEENDGDHVEQDNKGVDAQGKHVNARMEKFKQAHFHRGKNQEETSAENAKGLQKLKLKLHHKKGKEKGKGKDKKKDKDIEKGDDDEDEEMEDVELEDGEKKKEDKSKEDQDEIEKISIEQAFKQYRSSPEGIPDGEVQPRLEEYGRNTIEDHKKSPILKFLSYFANPLAIAMMVGAIISLFVFDWLDFGLILGLLILNAAIGFWEEARADDAISALKGQLALKAMVKRGGSDFHEVDAQEVVPGDIVYLKSGNVCPADCKIISDCEMKVDQSSLTGESLPASKKQGAAVYSGSTIKGGEGEAMIYATGKNTYFGKSAALVAGAETEGHYKKLLSAFGWFCTVFILTFVVMEIITQFGIRGIKCGRFSIHSYCPTINNLVVLIVGGVPIAMPTVLSVTMAIGAGILASKGAIVSRLTAVEDLAAMDVLCTDKTGTLTKNQLEVGEPHMCGDCSESQLIMDACLASELHGDNIDPIDKAILEYHEGHSEGEENSLDKYKILDFTPFDPVSKRTMSKVEGDGKTFFVVKGAPQVILDNATNKTEVNDQVTQKILEYASAGFRSLGVGRGDSENSWTMEGVIPLFDPPRDDTMATIQKAMSMGITVKMLTGDQQAIAAETARRLGMGTNIMMAREIDALTDEEFVESVFSHDGFSQVRPEHKYHIVEAVQSRGHMVGMTGDGVNDAPALKKANIGFAVSGATEAARSASDIVMTEPGLSVMVDAINESRRIFERMKNYSTYAISVTVRVVLTFSILTFAYNWYFPTVSVLIIAILNDFTILTISRDRVKPSPLPDKWNFREIFLMAFALGLWMVASTVVLFVLIKQTNFAHRFHLRQLNDDELRSLIYLQVSISGQATIFVTRTRGWFFRDRPATLLMCAFVLAQVIATILGVYGMDGYPNDGAADLRGAGWAWGLAAWIWCLVWFPFLDLIKFAMQKYVFTKNIPFIHPYSEEDRLRDEQLYRKSKAAHHVRVVRREDANLPDPANDFDFDEEGSQGDDLEDLFMEEEPPADHGQYQTRWNPAVGQWVQVWVPYGHPNPHGLQNPLGLKYYHEHERRIMHHQVDSAAALVRGTDPDRHVQMKEMQAQRMAERQRNAAEILQNAALENSKQTVLTDTYKQQMQDRTDAQQLLTEAPVKGAEATQETAKEQYENRQDAIQSMTTAVQPQTQQEILAQESQEQQKKNMEAQQILARSTGLSNYSTTLPQPSMPLPGSPALFVPTLAQSQGL